MLNQGRPTIEGRAKRSPNDGGSRLEMAHARGKVRGWDVWYMLSAFDRCGAAPGVGSFTPASERSEHRGIWVGGELRPVNSLPGGDKDHERSEYRCILERQEFVVRNGAPAEWRMTIS